MWTYNFIPSYLPASTASWCWTVVAWPSARRSRSTGGRAVATRPASLATTPARPAAAPTTMRWDNAVESAHMSIIGTDRVSKYVKQSSDVWPLFWKLLGVSVLIFTISFDILTNNQYWPNNFPFAEQCLFCQTCTLSVTTPIALRHGPHGQPIRADWADQNKLKAQNGEKILFCRENLPRVNFKY